MEPIMWLILLACFLVVEAITVGLTTIWFAGGALVAAIASGLGAGILTQWVLFLVIFYSAILSFILRLFIFVKEVKDGSFCILHPLSP